MEYNQIDALLKSTIEPRGDVADATGFSPWPGSINQLLFSLPEYVENLVNSGGVLACLAVQCSKYYSAILMHPGSRPGYGCLISQYGSMNIEAILDLRLMAVCPRSSDELVRPNAAQLLATFLPHPTLSAHSLATCAAGMMPEFVNPKYTDGTKTKFKSPTRLECMMQDYPKSLGPDARVGFTVVAGATTFSPVKTNLADARAKSKKGEPTYSAGEPALLHSFPTNGALYTAALNTTAQASMTRRLPLNLSCRSIRRGRPLRFSVRDARRMWRPAATSRPRLPLGRRSRGYTARRN